MIIFKTGESLEIENTDDQIFQFQGTIEVNPSLKYLFEKKNPFVPNESYNYGPYYTDKLNITIITDPKNYEELYFRTLIDETYIVAWNTLNGHQWRITKTKLPYPSTIRFINDKVNFNIETEPYHPADDMPSITHNFKYNRSTIANTIWNGNNNTQNLQTLKNNFYLKKTINNNQA